MYKPTGEDGEEAKGRRGGEEKIQNDDSPQFCLQAKSILPEFVLAMGKNK